MRYIDADELIRKIQEGYKFGSLTITELISECPSADVIKVVRCEKCTYGSIDPKNFNGYCRKRRDMIYANDFCSKGERIDE